MGIQNCQIMAGMGEALPECVTHPCPSSAGQMNWGCVLAQGGGLCLWVKPAAFVPVKLNVLRGRESSRPREKEQGKATLDIPSESPGPAHRWDFQQGECLLCRLSEKHTRIDISVVQ